MLFKDNKTKIISCLPTNIESKDNEDLFIRILNEIETKKDDIYNAVNKLDNRNDKFINTLLSDDVNLSEARIVSINGHNVIIKFRCPHCGNTSLTINIGDHAFVSPYIECQECDNGLYDVHFEDNADLINLFKWIDLFCQ